MDRFLCTFLVCLLKERIFFSSPFDLLLFIFLFSWSACAFPPCPCGGTHWPASAVAPPSPPPKHTFCTHVEGTTLAPPARVPLALCSCLTPCQPPLLRVPPGTRYSDRPRAGKELQSALIPSSFSTSIPHPPSLFFSFLPLSPRPLPPSPSLHCFCTALRCRPCWRTHYSARGVTQPRPRNLKESTPSSLCPSP